MHSGISRGQASAKKAVFLAAFAAVSGGVTIAARGTSTIAYTSGAYFQDFNNLRNVVGTSFSYAGNGTAPIDVENNGTAVTGWQFSKVAGTSADPKFIVDDGTASSFGGIASGSAYSLGTASASDRSLGSLASGSVTPVVGAVFVNNSTDAYTAFTISYTGEQWRDGGNGSVVNTLAFSYGVGNANVVTGTFVNATGLNFSSPQNSGGVPDIALDGNNAANQTAKNATVNGLSWAPGQQLVIRWADTNDAGNDDELGVDDLTFTAGFQGRNLTWNGTSNNTWNGTNTNWLDGISSADFDNNDTVNFGDTAVGTVVVDGAGVTPGDINVANTSGTYTFTGGSINGSGKLTKTNGGSLTLAAANGFTGGIALNGGVTNISDNNQLGGLSGNITMQGGTLRLTANVTSARNVTLASGTIDTNGNNGTFAGFSGTGNLAKVGNGTLTATGNYSVTGFTRVLGGTLKLAQASGTGTLQASEDPDFVGDLVLAGPMRLNIQGGHISGGGGVYVQSTGATISNSGSGQSTVIDNNIHLNSNNLGFPFVTTFGGTGGNDTTLNGVISGDSDLNITSGAAGGGSGTLIFNSHSTYTGDTLINNGTSAAGAGIIKLGVDDAFPTGTDVIVNTIGPTAYAGPGIMDLNGHSQTFASMTNGTGAGTAIFVIRNNGASPSTLTVSGSVTPSGAFTGNITNGTGGVSLVKAGSNTLVLAGSNSYAGNTTVNGGKLQLNGANAWGPVLSGPGKTDIAGSNVIFDYNDGSGDPVATVLADLTAAYASDFLNPADQLHSSTAIKDVIGLGWNDDTTAKQLSVVRTYFGDANLDGSVDTIDFGFLAQAFPSGVGGWAQGDFNYDGFVDTTDFSLLAKNFPNAPLFGGDAALGTLVPEPTSLAMLGLAAGGLIARRRRR